MATAYTTNSTEESKGPKKPVGGAKNPDNVHRWKGCDDGKLYIITWGGALAALTGQSGALLTATNAFYADCQNLPGGSVLGPGQYASIKNPADGKCYVYHDMGHSAFAAFISWPPNVTPEVSGGTCNCSRDGVVDWCSFDIYSPCAVAAGLHLQPLLNLTTFMNNMETHYNNTTATWGGCAWFQNRLDVWLPQLAGIHTGPQGGGGDWGNVNPLNVVHVAQKSAKIAWAQCMQENCCLFPPDPIGKKIKPLDNRDELDELQIPRINGEDGTKEIIACPCGWQPAFTTAYNHLFKGSPAGGTWHCLIPDHATTGGVNYSILADHIGTAALNGGEPVKGDKYHKPMTLQNLTWDTWDIFHVGEPIKTALFGNVFSEKVELTPVSGNCVTIVDKDFKSDFSNEDTFIIPPSDMPIIPQYRLGTIDQGVVAATSAASMTPCPSSHYIQNLFTTINVVYAQYNLPGTNGWYPWNFLSYQENGFLQYFAAGGYELAAGCDWFWQKRNQWVNQLANITAPIHHALKSSKIAWVDLMLADCGCSMPPPPPAQEEQTLSKIIEQNNY